ncbi:MAG: hypothetical protein MJE68_19145, partial [Proteobacteria bacterium]|nr:hypothetical protein [Pseudomonadota bacterium]
MAYPGTVTYDQGMILIEQLRVVREVVHENLSKFSVMVSAAEPSQPSQQTISIGIYDKRRFFGAVKQDTVCCLLTDTVDRE